MTASFPSDGMALTHILVVADVARSRTFYRDVLGATVFREYGGTSCVLEIFGTGLGATTPSVASGLVFSRAYSATSTPTVTIGGTAAAVSYCWLTGAGFYQISLTVPGGLAAGTYPVVVTQAEVSSPSTAVIKIAVN